MKKVLDIVDDIVLNLEVRDAFTEGEVMVTGYFMIPVTIEYVDFTWLYPYVNNEGIFQTLS